jgi:hypothetical protein
MMSVISCTMQGGAYVFILMRFRAPSCRELAGVTCRQADNFRIFGTELGAERNGNTDSWGHC